MRCMPAVAKVSLAYKNLAFLLFSNHQHLLHATLFRTSLRTRKLSKQDRTDQRVELSPESLRTPELYAIDIYPCSKP